MEIVNNGKCPHDPDATFDEVDSLRCPSCGYECEAEAMLTPFEPDPDKGPAPSEDEFDVFAEVVA